MRLNLYKIDKNYNKRLKNLDNKVLDLENGKEKRPLVGILIELGEVKYLAPLSSPKIKHLTMKNYIDFLKIDGGKLGVINFNNMIPVKEEFMIKIDPNRIECKTIEDYHYVELLKNQLTWINKNKEKIINKAFKLRKRYIENTLPFNVSSRCVNFLLLEENINKLT